MRRVSPSISDAVEPGSIESEDGLLSFRVRKEGAAVYVERIEPLTRVGRLSHMMRFEDVDSLDRAYETDEMRFKYPLVYWRLRRAVEEALQG